jgi:hypothetical protein
MEPGFKVSVNDFVIKALASRMVRVPDATCLDRTAPCSSTRRR